MQNKSVPTVARTRVFHVGTLNASQKGVQGSSQEGNGLSISLHPQEWTRIAKLGSGTTFKLTRKGGRFLDFHKMGTVDKSALAHWGLQKGFSVQKQGWKLSWDDCESGEQHYRLMDTEAAALSEFEFIRDEDKGARLEPVLIHALTPSAVERLGFTVDAISTLDMLATFWVEDDTALDGVWWNDILDPWALSAPRGVICKSRIGDWNVTPSL